MPYAFYTARNVCRLRERANFAGRRNSSFLLCAASLVLRVTRRALLLLRPRPFNHVNARSAQRRASGRGEAGSTWATGGRKGGRAKICPPGANPLSLIYFQGLADTMARYRNITSSQRDGFIKSLNNSILRATVVKWRGLETSSTCEVHVITLPFPAKVILNWTGEKIWKSHSEWGTDQRVHAFGATRNLIPLGMSLYSTMHVWIGELSRYATDSSILRHMFWKTPALHQKNWTRLLYLFTYFLYCYPLCPDDVWKEELDTMLCF